MAAKKYPFLRPRPPRLSELGDELREIEASGVYSNFGPVSRRAESALVEGLFDGVGAALLVANATLGLMIAIREAAGGSRAGGYALMPAYCFAATAQAALWAGLTPLLCDIDPGTWSAGAAAEDELLERYGDQVKCVVPYSCFGGGLDEARCEKAEWHVDEVLNTPWTTARADQKFVDKSRCGSLGVAPILTSLEGATAPGPSSLACQRRRRLDRAAPPSVFLLSAQGRNDCVGV